MDSKAFWDINAGAETIAADYQIGQVVQRDSLPKFPCWIAIDLPDLEVVAGDLLREGRIVQAARQVGCRGDAPSARRWDG